MAEPVYNYVYVADKLGISACAFETRGPFSIYGDHGRCVERLVVNRVLTADEAQLVADVVLDLNIGEAMISRGFYA